MTYPFTEVFGEYINNEAHREMLKNASFSGLTLNKEEMRLKALLHVDTFANIMCLKAVSNSLKAALRLRSVELDYVLPPEALNSDCFPMLLKVLKVNVLQTNGFIDNCKYEFDGETLTVTLLGGGTYAKMPPQTHSLKTMFLSISAEKSPYFLRAKTAIPTILKREYAK